MALVSISQTRNPKIDVIQLEDVAIIRVSFFRGVIKSLIIIP